MQLVFIFPCVFSVVCIVLHASTASFSDEYPKLNNLNPNETLETKDLYFASGNGESNISHNFLKLGCGGAIPIPLNGKPILVDYKSEYKYDSNERCIWLLDTAVARKRYAVKLKVTLKCEGLVDDGDKLELLDWTTWHLRSENIRGPKYVHEFPESQWFYLSFATNGALNGKGFILQLEVTSKRTPTDGSNFAFTNTSGVYTYDQKAKNERVAVIINPINRSTNQIYSTSLVAKINTKPMVTCKRYNAVYIFNVGCGGKWTKQILCGEKITYEFLTSDPLMVLYSSDSFSTTFQLTWSRIK